MEQTQTVVDCAGGVSSSLTTGGAPASSTNRVGCPEPQLPAAWDGQDLAVMAVRRRRERLAWIDVDRDLATDSEPDRDHDGFSDAQDACRDDFGPPPSTNGCPDDASDFDKDTVPEPRQQQRGAEHDD